MVNEKFFAIDAHCHIYPEKIAQKAVQGTDRFYDITSYGKGLVTDMINEGNRAGIDHYVVQSVATTPMQVSRINQFISSEVTTHKGKITGLGTLHPESSDIKGDLEELISLGLHGVKLHPDIQGFDLDFKGCLEIYELCQKYNLPILAHTGDVRYDHSNPNRLIPVLKSYPNLTFVGAHFGGWSLWEKASQVLNEFSNFYVDCSSSFYHITKDAAQRIIKNYGADKILFGTDYPMWCAKTEMDYLLSLGLNDVELEKILCLNAIKVFGIKL